MKFILSLIFIFSLNCCSYGQSNNQASKNMVIDKSKPSIFIDFKEIGEGTPIRADETIERVFLNLNNNSIWSIYVESFIYGDDEKTGIYYEIERENTILDSKVPKGYRPAHARSPASELRSGKSLSFSVPQNHLDENLKIRIDFKYEWETDTNLSNSPYSQPRHSIYFSYSELKKYLN